jgi:Zn-dependent M28 family amino/carboxypeptidase
MLTLKLSAGAVLLAAATSALAAAPVPGADKRLIEAHIAFLADDLLEGRGSGTRGYDIAASYVASQFRQYGVAPRGDKGGYLQAVSLRSTVLVADSPRMEVIGKDGSQALVFLDEFMMRGSLAEDKTEVTAPLVFVGHGIESPRFGVDDYAGVDAKGKIVVLLAGKPSNLPSEEGAHLGSGDHKQAMAFKHGAVGIITLSTPASEKERPFARGREFRNTPGMGWADASGKSPRAWPTLQNQATVSVATAHKLFAQAGARLDDIYAAAAANKPVQGMDLNLSVHMAKQSVRSDVASSNVVGMIEGSDAALKNEFVVYSAHLDHLGVIKEKTGDNIYNGAMDNASGVATLLETARMFSQSGVRPKRSILFLALTAEERGLLGSDYFANNPTVPLASIVANVNLDMPLLTYDFKNVMAFGAEHSSLKGTVQNALAKMGLGLIPDPWPEKNYFTRSDHYNFVRQGIPSLFLATGMESFNKDEAPRTLWDDFFSKHYHKPSDDMSQPFNFNAAARFAQLNYLIALEIANAPQRPAWNKGDFFGDTFSKPAAK